VLPVEEEYLTVHEVAALLRLNAQTVRNWIDRGELRAFRVGRRVRSSDFDRFVEAGSTVPPPQPSEGIWGGEVPEPVEPESRG
jgi:excisionase family DNA binding protein